ncbi:septal ring lytic transglycosylase RlpA family protein [Solilutibacter silvestris]|uniref:Endolytic peptidoglycan transglycosylase RlpA n=1 Tax=Solilutibacter silvestris TaxID=1645665 RepID=A0A2K1Q037_9GAMM|nr:septal ring lytic transglycosylase RlpA family protein [Lysobacter silvestris]PNS08404.1 rare lipoprotein A rlpA [Lysobacter silvestris]
MKRVALAIALPVALAACSSAPPKSQPATTRATTIPKATPRATTATATNPSASPYAPAQEDASKRGQMVGDIYRPDIRDSVPGEIPDVNRIPEPTVKAEPRSKRGNKSYAVLGKNYSVLDDSRGYSETGTASYYGNKFHGRRTSNEEVYDMYAFTAAHRTLPLPSFARVTNLDNGKSVVVRINDRGPFHSNRLIDLSYAAAVKLGYREKGTAHVRVDALTPEESRETNDAIELAAAAKTDPAAKSQLAQQVADGKVPAGVALASSPAVAEDYRFDMMQNGKVMTSTEFDAWMKARGLHVATGKPGKPDAALTVLPAVTPSPVTQVATTSASSPATAPPSPKPVASAATATMSVARAPAPPIVTSSPSTSTTTAAGLTLQVAAFSSQQNAEHALDIVQHAGVSNARIVEGWANGRRFWRLRVVAMNSAEVPTLSARISGLGFGTPNPVRD